MYNSRCSALLVVLLGILLGSAMSTNESQSTEVVRFNIRQSDSSRSFKLQLSDGQYRMESITFADDTDPMRPLEVTGEYSYTDNQDRPVTVIYSAGTNGYVAHVRFEPRITIRPIIENRILPTKIQDGDGIGCALRASLCG